MELLLLHLVGGQEIMGTVEHVGSLVEVHKPYEVLISPLQNPTEEEVASRKVQISLSPFGSFYGLQEGEEVLQLNPMLILARRQPNSNLINHYTDITCDTASTQKSD